MKHDNIDGFRLNRSGNKPKKKTEAAKINPRCRHPKRLHVVDTSGRNMLLYPPKIVCAGCGKVIEENKIT